MTRTLKTTLTACLALSAVACDDAPTAGEASIDAPAFSPSGKHDGAEQAIRYIQGVGTQAQVQGRFQPDLKWRGFTFEAQAGQQISVDLSAQLERNGLLIEETIDTQVLLYGPAESQDALFEQVIADSGLVQQARLDVELEKDGFYLLAATRDDAVQQAQFDLEIECANCGAQDGDGDELLCKPGRLFVEGAKLKSQVWDRCEVVVLEPARLPAEEKLTIGPDVHVRAHYYITDFHPEGWGEVRLIIEGELDMQSTPEHRIVFESNVEGKQWDGLRIARPGTVLHDFVFQDTHEGLYVEKAAEGTRIVNGEFLLNRYALQLRGAAGIEIEGLDVHDNQVGVRNLSADSRRFEDLDSLFLLDSEFYLNDTAINLGRLQGSFIDGLSVHDNDAGIRIANEGGETAEPENWVAIGNSRFVDNGLGIDLRGNGSIDHCEFLRNATHGVQTSLGWQKVKNSVFESNSHACETPGPLSGYLQAWFIDCSAAVATPEAHTVFRNNIVEKNDGYGIAILGTATTQRRTVGRDPAVLNSLIRANSRGGIALVDAPVYSVEFNIIKDNSEGAIHLAYSAQAGQLMRVGFNRESMQQEVLSVFVRPNRVQRNNIETDETVFHRFIYRRINTDAEEVPLSIPAVQNAGGGFSNVLTLSNNFVPAADVEAMQALDDLTGFDVMPLLDAPEATAGLIREIEPFDE